jgi:hypothetical protein
MLHQLLTDELPECGHFAFTLYTLSGHGNSFYYTDSEINFGAQSLIFWGVTLSVVC